MNQYDRRIHELSHQSVDRLKVLNSLRDRLLKHSDVLTQLGILAVVGFGSTIRGKATDISDLDVGILIDKQIYPNLDVFSSKSSQLESVVSKICDGLDMPIAFGHAKEIAEKKDVIHIVFGRVDSASDRPDYAKESVVMWENQTNSILKRMKKSFSGILRGIRKKRL